MTKEQVEASKRICEATISGPWENGGARLDGWVVKRGDRDIMRAAARGVAEFAAHARTALPEALKEIERLREALADETSRADFEESMRSTELKGAQYIAMKPSRESEGGGARRRAGGSGCR